MAFLDETGLAELWAIIGDKYDSRANVAIGSYVGTGVCGADNPNSITFDFEPKMVWVFYAASATTSRTEDDYLIEHFFVRPTQNVNLTDAPLQD